VNQPIKQPTIFMKWSIAKNQARSRQNWESSLRREECSRSSCRLSLRRDCDNAPGRFRELSLRRGGLAWARQFVAKKYSPSPRRALEQKTWSSFRYSRLGEMSSPRRVYQCSPLYHTCSIRDSLITTPKAFSHHHKQHTITKNTKQDQITPKSE